MDVSWAIDFFTVTTINFATLYVFLVLDHGRREVIHFAVTRHRCWKGLIDDVRIYSYALSEEEIGKIYATELAGSIKD